LNGRFQVQPVTYQRAAFAAIQDSTVAPVNLMRRDPFKKLVETDVSPQGLDAYIVITKAKSNFAGGARRIEGIGFITFGTLLASSNHIHALYEIRVIDGKTFDVIEKMAAPSLDDVGVRIAGPSRTIDETFAPGTGNPASPSRMIEENLLVGAAIQTKTRSCLAPSRIPPHASLSSTLNDMHIGGLAEGAQVCEQAPLFLNFVLVKR
jgi:hypothetical protein